MDGERIGAPYSGPLADRMRRIIHDLLEVRPDDEKKAFIMAAHAAGTMTDGEVDFWFQVFELHGE